MTTSTHYNHGGSITFWKRVHLKTEWVCEWRPAESQPVSTHGKVPDRMSTALLWATSVHSNKADSPSCVHTLESYVFELIVSQKARFCRAFAGRKYHYASVSFSPMQSEIRIGSLAVKSWRNRVLQTKNLGFRTAERSVPEPRDKSSMSFHSFKRRAGCWRGFGEENRDRRRWRGGGTGAGLIQMHHCQAARTHTHTQAHNEGPKGQQCVSGLIMMKYMPVMWTAPRCALGRQAVTNLSAMVCHSLDTCSTVHTLTHTHTLPFTMNQALIFWVLSHSLIDSGQCVR